MNDRRAHRPARGWATDLPRCRITDKVSHRGKREARRSLERQNAHGMVDPGHRLVVYQCKHCGCWHVGTQRPPEERSRERWKP